MKLRITQLRMFLCSLFYCSMVIYVCGAFYLTYVLTPRPCSSKNCPIRPKLRTLAEIRIARNGSSSRYQSVNWKDSSPATEYHMRRSVNGTKYKSFCIFRNYLKSEGEKAKGNVTLVTHTSFHFLYYIIEHADYWNGPVSLSLYLENFTEELPVLDALIRCFPKVRSKVSIHLLLQRRPLKRYCLLSIKTLTKLSCGIFANKSVIPSLFASPALEKLYPMKILKNLARSASLTPFILTIDIDIIVRPANCVELVSSLLDKELTENLANALIIRRFEVDENVTDLPKDKEELSQLIIAGKANAFEALAYPHGHPSVPNLESWLQLPKKNETCIITDRLRYIIDDWDSLVLFTKKSVLPYEETFPYQACNNEQRISDVSQFKITTYTLCKHLSFLKSMCYSLSESKQRLLLFSIGVYFQFG